MTDLNMSWYLRGRLKTRHLLLLVALEEHRNLGQAATALMMTQPGASKQLKELEDTLGVSLFDRLPKDMRPTQYGEIMIRHARMMLARLGQAHEEIVSLRSGLIGNVNVGVVMQPAIDILPRAIIRVKQKSPLLNIGIELDSSNVLVDRLKRGLLDLLIARIMIKDEGSELLFEEIGEEPICAVVRNGHPFASVKKLELKDTTDCGWIISPKDRTLHHQFEMLFRRQGLLPPVNTIETMSTIVALPILHQTDFLHAMPLTVAKYFEQLNVLTILPLALPFRIDTFGIVTLRDHLLSNAAQHMLDEIRITAKENPTS